MNIDKEGNYQHGKWKDGLISGMEQRIETLESRLNGTHHAIAELQEYVAKQTPFTNEPVSCEWCNYYECQCEDKEEFVEQHVYPLECSVSCVEHKDALIDRRDLIDTLRVAFKGLKPGATATQNNIAFHSVRGMLSHEEEE